MKHDSAEVFNDIVENRRSVRIYDQSASFDGSAVERSLKRALLAPNSSNLQLWEFYRVKNPETRQLLAEFCLGQKAASTANELIVVVTRIDKWKERSRFVLNKALQGLNGTNPKQEKLISTYYQRIIPALYIRDPLRLFSLGKKMATTVMGWFKPMAREVTASDMRVVVHKSAALAAQTFMLSMKAEGYDSCPMEGFDSVRVKKLLNLPASAEINMIIGVGTAMPEGIYGPRVRVDEKEVVFNI